MLLDKSAKDYDRVEQLNQFTSSSSAIKSRESIRKELQVLTDKYMKKNKLKEIETLPIVVVKDPIEVEKKRPILDEPLIKESYLKIPKAGKSGHLFIVQRGDRFQLMIKSRNYGYFDNITNAITVRDETLKMLNLNRYGWTVKQQEKYDSQIKNRPLSARK